jgi:hypothetical protein
VSSERYEIRIQGTLDPEWSDWFEGMEIRSTVGGQTILAGFVPDQAALLGILARVGDLNLPLVSVNPVDATGPDAAGPQTTVRETEGD